LRYAARTLFETVSLGLQQHHINQFELEAERAIVQRHTNCSALFLRDFDNRIEYHQALMAERCLFEHMHMDLD